MDDIEKAFGGKFKEQRNSESAWTPVPEEQVPKPRSVDRSGSSPSCSTNSCFPCICAGFTPAALVLLRPGSCAGEGSAAAYKSSTSFPDETLTFIKSYPLMDESVPSVNDRPYFTRTTSRSVRPRAWWGGDAACRGFLVSCAQTVLQYNESFNNRIRCAKYQ